jgi:hypothetical protein
LPSDFGIPKSFGQPRCDALPILRGQSPSRHLSPLQLFDRPSQYTFTVMSLQHLAKALLRFAAMPLQRFAI